MKPVYFINGFLESGKTQFIRFTISQPYFQIKGKTLIILCEEGEEEYPEKVLKAAGMTYVAALSVSLVMLIRIFLIRGNRS